MTKQFWHIKRQPCVQHRSIKLFILIYGLKYSMKKTILTITHPKTDLLSFSCLFQEFFLNLMKHCILETFFMLDKVGCMWHWHQAWDQEWNTCTVQAPSWADMSGCGMFLSPPSHSVDKRQLNAACLQYWSCLPDRQSRTQHLYSLNNLFSNHAAEGEVRLCLWNEAPQAKKHLQDCTETFQWSVTEGRNGERGKDSSWPWSLEGKKRRAGGKESNTQHVKRKA